MCIVSVYIDSVLNLIVFKTCTLSSLWRLHLNEHEINFNGLLSWKQTFQKKVFSLNGATSSFFNRHSEYLFIYFSLFLYFVIKSIFICFIFRFHPFSYMLSYLSREDLFLFALNCDVVDVYRLVDQNKIGIFHLDFLVRSTRPSVFFSVCFKSLILT